MSKDSVDVVYVVASKLGSIGMGTTAYNAVRQLEDSELSYKVICRGYDKSLKLNKKNIISAGYLEYLSLPLRFAEKKLKLKINPFRFINKKFGKFVEKKLLPCKIYHTWIGISHDAVKKAKKQGAIIILEGANSHPNNVSKILNQEYKRFHQNENLMDSNKIKKDSIIYHDFDYVMCPSDFVYDSFIKEGFKKNQLIKTPYGVDINKFTPGKKQDKKFRVLFVGSIQLRKGIQYLLQAWKELDLKNAELIVAGRVWPDAAKVVEEYKNLGSIKFVGFDPSPVSTFQNCDIFVSPSLEEGSALTCYEAMACGLPVLATYNTGSVISDGKEGFIVPIRDVKALKLKIKFLYEHPDLISKMGKNARKKAEKFSWENYGKRLKTKYKETFKK